jgi:hypothetical protein
MDHRNDMIKVRVRAVRVQRIADKFLRRINVPHEERCGRRVVEALGFLLQVEINADCEGSCHDDINSSLETSWTGGTQKTCS